MRKPTDLADDFSRRQVAGEIHLPGETEATPHRTADLGRHAERLAWCIRDEHRLDEPTIAQSQQKLHGVIRRALSLLYGGRTHDEAPFELLSEAERQVGHPTEVGDTSSVDPPIYLPSMERLNTELTDGNFELGRFQLGYVYGRRHRVESTSNPGGDARC